MSDDLIDRLRALPPQPADPPDRFASVARRVSRRRRAVLVADMAVVLVVLVAATLVAVASLRHGKSAAPAVPELTCPRVFAGTPPWVPAPPSGVDGRERLVPRQAPARAVLCAYDGSNVPRAQSGWTLSGSHTLSGGFDRLAHDLTSLPRLLPGQRHACPAIGGPQTDYLLGLSYPDGTLWVSGAAEPTICMGTSNGVFTSPANTGALMQASYTAGTWTRPPPRHSDDPCRGRPIGRLGQESVLVPDHPASVRICQGPPTEGQRLTYRTVTLDHGFDDLVAALNTLTTTPWAGTDRIVTAPTVYYEVDFRYPDGRDVQLAVDPSSVPAIDNGSLQARDASTVVPILQRLLG